MLWAIVGHLPSMHQLHVVQPQEASILAWISEMFGMYSHSDSSSLAAFSASLDAVLRFLIASAAQPWELPPGVPCLFKAYQTHDTTRLALRVFRFDEGLSVWL